MNNTTQILEVFSSIQGEGLQVGERQIFIRFHGCNLSCAFCDVDKNREPFSASAEDILKRIDELNVERIHNTVALTGGEPLLHNVFLKRLLPGIAERGLKIYLETNGTLAPELEELIEYIDIIAVDIKLPSVSKNKPCWQKHQEFLKVAFEKEFFVKVVVSSTLDMEDFEKAVEIMKDISFDIPFVIQPETKTHPLELNIGPERLLKLQETAVKSLNRVLVIPQVHKMLGVQ